MTQITTVNPATGEEITTFSSMDKNQVFDLVRKARRAFPEWKKDYEKRASFLEEEGIKISSDRRKILDAEKFLWDPNE
ncbi:MAG: aldehyde dehydrogenase family protein [Nitrosopumilus sp.]